MLKVGRFYINPQQQLLLDENKNEIALEAKVQEILFYLFDNRDRYVSLEELHENVWSGRIVSDSAVRRTISKLRKLFDDNGEEAEYIKSVVKKGYKFVCDVEEEEKEEESQRPKNKFRIKWKKVFYSFLYIAFITLFIFIANTTFFKIDTLVQEHVLAVTRNPQNGDYAYIGYSPGDTRYQLFYRPDETRNDEILAFSHDPLLSPIFIKNTIWVGWQSIDSCGLLKVDIKTKKSSKISLNCSTLVHMSIVNNGEFLITMRPKQDDTYQSYLFKIKNEKTFPISDAKMETPFIASLSSDENILAMSYPSLRGSTLRLLDLKNNLQIKNNDIPEKIIQLRWQDSVLKLATESSLYKLDNKTGALEKFDVRTNLSKKTKIIDFSIYAGKVQVLHEEDKDTTQHLNTYIERSGHLELFNTTFLDPHMLPVLNDSSVFIDHQPSGYILKNISDQKILATSNNLIQVLTSIEKNKSIVIFKNNKLEIINKEKGTLQYRLDAQGDVKQAIPVPNMDALWLITLSPAGWQTLLWNYKNNSLSALALHERIRFFINGKLFWVDSRDGIIKSKSKSGDIIYFSKPLHLSPESTWIVSDDSYLWFTEPRPYVTDIYKIKVGSEQPPSIELRIRGLLDINLNEKNQLTLLLNQQPQSLLSSSFRLFSL
ncbi:DNA-binding winged helix-turn-helix (wHTH) protein [Gallaecimonas pentaromativorans]|uniref:DNA-binding winged helix-turn-helix (WHTH) protein n=1 Tax=Gallaecimonas pentaromativorans TaxID=584787 RepID=A0A3N1P0J5_9GAMM|nr:DNA-binding winged helix-turn-helix (wHTH) protein [Gallaecimonas pentaromativorans]